MSSSKEIFSAPLPICLWNEKEGVSTSLPIQSGDTYSNQGHILGVKTLLDCPKENALSIYPQVLTPGGWLCR